jgi:hypothetical protein
LIKVSKDSINNKNRKRIYNLLEINNNNKDFLSRSDSNKRKEDFYYLNLKKSNLKSVKLEKIMIKKYNKEKKKENKN